MRYLKLLVIVLVLLVAGCSRTTEVYVCGSYNDGPYSISSVVRVR